MKKVKNLDELVELIGMKAVEKCFTEYMMLTIAKAKEYDRMQDGELKKKTETYCIKTEKKETGNSH